MSFVTTKPEMLVAAISSDQRFNDSGRDVSG